MTYKLSAYFLEACEKTWQRQRLIVLDLLKHNCTAFRLWPDHEDSFKGVELDYYQGYGVLKIFEGRLKANPAKLEAWWQWLCATWQGFLAENPQASPQLQNAELLFKGVYLKRFPQDRSQISGKLAPELFEAKPWWGTAAPFELQVLHLNAKCFVRLYDGYSTGLFFDQRQNHAWLSAYLERLAQSRPGADLQLLNLFSYTGVFSLIPACRPSLQSRLKIDSLDLSQPYLNWAQKNFQLNNLSEQQWLRQNFFEFRSTEKFDCIVLDPPSFGHTGPDGKAFSTQKHWSVMLQKVGELLSDTGLALLTLNTEGFPDQAIDKVLAQISAAQQRRVFNAKLKADRENAAWLKILQVPSPEGALLPGPSLDCGADLKIFVLGPKNL